MSQEGNRVTNTFRLTLTGGVTKGYLVTAAGALGGNKARILGVALEDGVSTDKIAVQISGIASVIVGSAGATAGGPAKCDAAGKAVDDDGAGGIIWGQFLESGTVGQSVQVNMWAH